MPSEDVRCGHSVYGASSPGDGHAPRTCRTDPSARLCHAGIAAWSQFRVGRRTAQRLRDAVLRIYPQTEQLTDNERRPRWRIPTTGVVTPGAFSAEDVVDLESTAQLLKQRNLRKRASALEDIARKLK